MHKLSIELLEKFSDILQTGSSSPNQKVTIYRGDKKGKFENMPFVLPEITRITIDRRWNMAADELEVEMSNINGYYSPEYSNKKEFQNVSNLPLSGYTGVIKAFNKVECELGYSNSLIRVFTGQIQNVSIAENTVSIKFNALNAYRKLLKPIDPIHSRKLVYENKKAFEVVKDLCNKAGIEEIIYDNESIPTKDTDTPDSQIPLDNDNSSNSNVTGITIENDFAINKIEFQLGTNYSDAIKKILDIMNHRIIGGRYGEIQILKKEMYTQQDFHNWEFDDFVNLTEGEYKVDSSIIRNRVIVMADNGWQAFEDKFLIEYCNGEVISSGIEAKWAETLEQKWAVADEFFMSMRRKLRRISVMVIGNPAMDIGDLVKMRMLTSTANDKYMIIGIQSDFSSSGYFEQVDLEYIGSVLWHLCDKAEGEYELPKEDLPIESVETEPVVMTLRDKIVDEAKKYLGIYYQWGGNYPENNNYGLDCSHFTYRVLNKFGFMDRYRVAADQHTWCKSISKSDLQPGDLCFYKYGGSRVQHVVMYIGNGQIIGANGGGRNTTTQSIARKQGAKVKIDNMGKPSYYGRPPGLE